MHALRRTLAVFAFVATSAGAISSARADAPCSGCRDDATPERLHLEVDYQRWSLPVADSTFGATGFPSHTGRELGFVAPTLNVINFRDTWYLGRTLGLVTDIGVGWAASDATPTDAFAQHVKGDLIAMQFGFGIEGVVPLGNGLKLRASAIAGLQTPMIPLDIYSGRSNSVVVLQFFIRPRLAFEIPLSDHVGLGVFATDDVIRATSWGGGAYVGFSLL